LIHINPTATQIKREICDIVAAHGMIALSLSRELAEIERSSSEPRVTVNRYDTAKRERHSRVFESPPLGPEI
jgi:hypothetical protein